MATIKPIEARSVHQIQSGQVIVDLCSVVKELVENSLDAGATSVEVRFKNNGLDSIEVQDNGTGISPPNYESLALKHHTSKLASYDDLSSLQTFGFRGEALSSLCALSNLYVITALAEEAPKGKRLDFEHSGKLKDVTVVAAQKGTTVVVEGLFEELPVRRKELTKNIKKEYGKVLGLLHAYACISTNVKFTVKSSMAKGKNATVFATKANPTTKENIANVYGAKTLSALVLLELQLEFQGSMTQKKAAAGSVNNITVRGHISRPVFGEGRQTPDRQMFFVNGRPCGLPQVAKAFNEVYKSFNVSQSPFIFANFEMDTNAYDVNVSPDKRTIMLHDSAALLDSLKSSLAELFDQQEQTVPQSHTQASRLPAFKQLTITRESTAGSTDSNQSGDASNAPKQSPPQEAIREDKSLLHDFFRGHVNTREEPKAEVSEATRTRNKKKLAEALEKEAENSSRVGEYDDLRDLPEVDQAVNNETPENARDIRVRDFNLRIAEQQKGADGPEPFNVRQMEETEISPSLSSPLPPRSSAIQTAFDRVRPTRPIAEAATITVGDKTINTVVGHEPHSPDVKRTEVRPKSLKTKSPALESTQAFTQRLKGFAAPGTQGEGTSSDKSPEPELVDETEAAGPDSDLSVTDNDPTSAGMGQPAVDDTDEDAVSSSRESAGSRNGDTDGEYIEESEKKAQEVATVAELIRLAEERATLLNVNNARRANKVLKSGSPKELTTSLQCTIPASIEHVRDLTRSWHLSTKALPQTEMARENNYPANEAENEEARLALTVSKADFFGMHIVGQFNLGFILAVRCSSSVRKGNSDARNADELFIVDQHASDEKYNFETLQAETVVVNQRLVQPKQLDLTAVEEEVLIENLPALEKNGFIVRVDDSGDEPIGRRCKLVSLPLSKEVTFGLGDLEELLHLLAESPGTGHSAMVPRPSKVRKMFAMRACRSSTMIGKTLTEGKMRTIISHMGDIDKPWNCPHGRPTMRHLMTLNSFDTWQEGDGVMGGYEADVEMNIWRNYAQISS